MLARVGDSKMAPMAIVREHPYAEKLERGSSRQRSRAARALAAQLFDYQALREGISAGVTEQGDAGRLVSRRMREALEQSAQALRDAFYEGLSAEALVDANARRMDAVVAGALDFAADRLYRLGNPTAGEEIAVLATGGYGRGELAPHSDIDLLFLYPYKRTPLLEQLAEFLLYRLWDQGLKVGQATRSIADCVKLAGRDLTICTSLLEGRLVWGSKRLFDEMHGRFRAEVIEGKEPEFIEDKLNERDERHKRTGDSRYLLEPNIKENKGGLRDLQTLVWIGRALFDIEELDDLVSHEVLSERDLSNFLRSRRFLWTVRCHLHYVTGRCEERLTFDLQTKIAELMGYRGGSQSGGVERFMKRYYLVAKDVGSLTRIVCAALEEQHRRQSLFKLPRFGFSRRRIGGFTIANNRVSLAEPDLFEREPVRMLELFHIAENRGIDVHPEALRAAARNRGRIDADIRRDPQANRLFLETLCGTRDPAQALHRMNEVQILGRFVPEFGQIVAQMQHDLYHVYTVDEHTIRAIGGLAAIERGELTEDLPLASELLPKMTSRTELFVATFLHDIGKGRGEDHSIVGAEIARHLCPRLGLRDESTETVAWLVRHHLVMSRYAFKRDTEDPKTVQDFVAIVQSPERLKLLLVLTAIDIRAVGPQVWNGWKGQLLRELYHEAEALLVSGDAKGRRQARIEKAKEKLADALALQEPEPWSQERIEAYLERHDPRYWLGVEHDAQVRHAALVDRAERSTEPVAMEFHIDRFRARTELALYASDHAGLFMKLAGALAVSGVRIVDAHIFTTTDGMALDTFGVQDIDSATAVDDCAQLERIRKTIERTLRGELWLERALAGRRTLPSRAHVFEVEPRVLINNQASRTHSVVEVNGRDRPGLLFDVAKVMKDLGLVIHSAHISTFGERVVDVFYVKNVFGLKIEHPQKTRHVADKIKAVL